MKSLVYFYLMYFIFSTVINQCLAIHVPVNVMETIKEHIQRQQQHQSNEISAVKKLQQQPHEKSYDINDDVVVDYAEDRNSSLIHYEEKEIILPTLDEREMQYLYKNEKSYVINDVNNNEVEQQQEHHERYKRQLTDILIAPNTHWCGRGNTANNTYNTLGGASLADKCCRRHDHCKVFIPSMSKRYALFNYRPYTLSHCSCDRRFRTCLKMANDDNAKTIGKLFFNIVQTNCFVLKPESRCTRRSADGTCEKDVIKKKAYLQTNQKF